MIGRYIHYYISYTLCNQYCNNAISFVCVSSTNSVCTGSAIREPLATNIEHKEINANMPYGFTSDY